IDLINNIKIIEQLYNIKDKLPKIIKKRYNYNKYKNILVEDKCDKMITGPSHIDLWYRKFLKNEVSKPTKYHLLPIPAVSLFSQQLENLIAWWNEWFGSVILFVPDFRIGNVCTNNKVKDGRFIRQDLVSNENSLQCFKLGIEALNKFSQRYQVTYWFWCLLGCEEFNRSKNHYKDNNGNYKHPIWNYNEIL
ncbi:antibiotic acetyltransferase, partial [Escherichia coli]|nr:antibiotic acetyltransferase [Escherichia coli]